ncbi:tyrosine-protein phosphatase RLPH2-like [Rutidosis leptorrhynchoides]|uniref:tyrosine-protein phosphatase RLPH2-like n=1 Tax=Rutidosis leptorrhynchoides TaxID=125765 RepID=UPI003A994466
MENTTNEKVVICIGDIHGYVTKIKNLWSNLQNQINQSEFESAHIIFLGDYCDHGPDTREVLDFLISLPSKHPKQSHVFLAGNHDLGFAAFVGALSPPADGSMFSATWDAHKSSEEIEGWYKGDGYENMHLQGRRWGGDYKIKFNVNKGQEFKGSVYNAGSTFSSYGFPHGSPDFIKAFPSDHNKFLANMAWIHEEDDVCIYAYQGTKCCKLIVVRGSFVNGKDLEEQMKSLRERDTKIPEVKAISWRWDVRDMHEELSKQETILVSGHHGELHIEGLRLIIDEGDGLETNPLAAMVLPYMKIIRDTDTYKLE